MNTKATVLFLYLILNIALIQAGEPAPTFCQKPENWQLSWSEEFNYEGLPDSKTWIYEEGFVRNKEMQYYTKGKKRNARVTGGCLIIEAHKEELPNAKYDPKSKSWKKQRPKAHYTSASINTKGKVDWLYGRIEVKAKLPQGKGVWPAIWMLGSNVKTVGYPYCGELDIMEYVGQHPENINATVHWPVKKDQIKANNNKKYKSQGGKHHVKNPCNDFHIFAMEWDSKKIDFFYDNVKYFTFDIDKAGKGKNNPFRKPQFLLLNLALGGWGGPIDDTIFPQKYIIDYVRVFKKK